MLPVLLISLFLSACQKKEQSTQTSGLKVVTSFYPIYALTKEISGSRNDVRMIHSQNGIHSFEPSVSDVAQIYDADLFIYHAKSLESWAKDLDGNLKGHQVAVLEASKGLALEKVEGLEDVAVDKGVDEASFYDPHTWTDPILAADEAEQIADFLSEHDPKHKKEYQANAAAFRKKAESLTTRYQEKFEKASSKTMVTQHTAFAYLARRFGLTQLGIAGISPEQEPSPRQLGEIKDFVTTYQVKTIFTEENVSSKTADVVAKATGAKVKVLSPLETVPKQAGDYLEHVEANLETLYQTLK